MEEAERLCDRVAIVDHGRIVALDTVPNLIASPGTKSSLSFTVDGAPPIDRLEAVPGVARVERVGGRVVVHGNGNRFPQGVIGVLAETDLWAQDLRTNKPPSRTCSLSSPGPEDQWNRGWR
ncbi:MAG: hypothetical protein ACRDST_03515 [Pseudonocardiaceae bacterium]